MSNLKTYGAIAIMLGCFVVVYPRFMHPIFLSMFGMRDPPQKTQQEHDPMYPPGYKGHPGERPQPKPDDSRRHMRPGPHPGMRAAAEMHRQQNQQGSGRGMMGVVLPMYAVGIVLYLGYTLYKVFNKPHTKSNNGQRYNWDKSQRYGERDRMGFPKDFDGNSDITNFLHDQEHRQNLEDLLTRVDDKNVSVEEMRVLQQRLEETEAQMTRILQAMQGIHANVDNVKKQEDNTDASTDKKDGHKNEQEEGASKETSKTHDKTDDAKTDGDSENPAEEKEEAKGNPEEGKEEKEVNGDQAEDEAIDELIEAKKEDDDDSEQKGSNVRQRNVKSNEQ